MLESSLVLQGLCLTIVLISIALYKLTSEDKEFCLESNFCPTPLTNFTVSYATSTFASSIGVELSSETITKLVKASTNLSEAPL